MAETIGYESAASARAGYRNSDNVVADLITAPDSGWVTEIRLAGAAGYNEPTAARLCLWSEDGGLLWVSTQQPWGTGFAQRVATIPDREAVRVQKGQRVYAGFWRDPSMMAQWYLAGNYYFDTHSVMTYTGSNEPPQYFVPANHYQYNLAVSVLFERNQKPLKGAWQPPTPAGSTGELRPYFAGTMPHAGEGTVALASGFVSIDSEGQPAVRPEAGGGFLISYAGEDNEAATGGPRGVYLDEVARRTSGNQSVEAARLSQRNSAVSPAGGDARYDFSSMVRVYAQRSRDLAVVVDASFEPTDGEVARGYFERQIYDFPNTKEDHVAYFMHRDQWGVWSDWSDGVTFRPYAGPAAPDAVGPYGKQPSGADITYSSTYQHPEGLSAKAARVVVFGGYGSLQLYDSGVVALPQEVRPGGRIDVPSLAFHPVLKEGGSYLWYMQTQDTAGAWSAFALKQVFSINRRPAKPVYLQPSGGIPTFASYLYAFVYDNDQDAIQQAELDLFQADGTHVSGYPKSMQIEPTTHLWAGLEVGQDLVQGHDFKFTVRAYDGIDWGDWSDFASFRYVSVPTVELYSPAQGGVVNLAKQPSAEGDPNTVSDWWEEFGEDASNYAARVVDANAGEGVASWEMRSDGTGTHGMRSSRIEIGPNDSVFLRAMAKRISGVPRHRLLLLFEDDAGAVLSTVRPEAVAGVSPLDWNQAQPTSVETFWKDYGGLVLASQIPDAATAVRVYLERTAGGSGDVVRFDAFMPVVAKTASLSNFSACAGFWGYVDGDMPVFAGSDDRLWQAAPHDSVSAGPARLVGPQTSLEIGYSSTDPKVDDYYVLEQKDTNGAWKAVYQTAYSNSGPRTVIPIPTTTIRNEGRYGLTVYCKSALGLEGRTPRVEFDVEYEGPPEPRISQVAGDPQRAEVVVQHDPTDEDPNSFSHWEMRITDEQSGEAVTYVSEDHSQERFVHPFPRSGVQYTYELRQVVLVGSQQLEGRFTTARGSVDYYPVFFLKDAFDPLGKIVAFKILMGDLPTETNVRPMKQYVMWEGKKPRAAFGKPDYETGSLTIHLFDEPQAPGFAESAEVRLRTLMGMISSGGVWCFLGHHPTRKRFVALNGDPGRSVTEIEDYVYKIDHTEVEFFEDYFKREVLG